MHALGMPLKCYFQNIWTITHSHAYCYDRIYPLEIQLRYKSVETTLNTSCSIKLAALD